MIAIARCRLRAGGPASGRAFLAMVTADVGAEVAEPGLAGRPTLVWAQVGNRVVHVDGSADRGGVGEYVGGIAQQQLFAQPIRTTPNRSGQHLRARQAGRPAWLSALAWACTYDARLHRHSYSCCSRRNLGWMHRFIAEPWAYRHRLWPDHRVDEATATTAAA